MTPLYSLKGSELLPKKKPETKYFEEEPFNFGKEIGNNEAVTQIEKCFLVVDEEKLAEIFWKQATQGMTLSKSWKEVSKLGKSHYINIAKALSSTINQWLEIRMVEE